MREAVNGWVGGLFPHDTIDRAVEALVASQHPTGDQSDAREAATKRLSEAEVRRRRFQARSKPVSSRLPLIDAINQAQAARAELDHTPALDALTTAEVYAMVDDVGEALSDTSPERLSTLYQAIGLQTSDEPSTHTVEVTIQPAGRVNGECVRGAICTLAARLLLDEVG